MRSFPLKLCLAILAFSATCSTGVADDPSYQAARMSARRDLEVAKLELRQYWQVEYPRQRRHLNAQIELTEAEIKAYRQRLRAYDPYDRFSRGRPLMVTLQELKMCLLDAELRLRDLWAERNALVRFHSVQWRLLEQKVHAARLRVVELEADAAAENEPLAQRP